MHTSALSIDPAPQHMRALEQANRVRLARAALKRSIAAGESDVTEILLTCPWMTETMPLGELLASQRRWGRTRSTRFLRSVGLAESKTVASLTERQRVLLSSLLTAKRGEAAR